MAADPQPDPQWESQEEILLAAVASLADAHAPPGEQDYARYPDPDTDTGCPAELAGLTGPELDQLLAAAPAPVADFGPAGMLDRDGTGRGAGFADGGVLDTLDACLPLAGFADDAHHRLGQLTGDELIGVLRAWRRQTSWSQARELAAVAELARRLPADRTPAAAPGEFPAELSEFIADEVALALTLTRRSGEMVLGLALDLADRPAIAAALEAGRIDLYKARIILDAVGLLSDEHAAAVEAAVLSDAPGQTSGQLRAAVHRAVLLLDPEAARRRREEAQKDARVECYTDNEGTATLTGRWLPPAEVLAADKRLCQVAAWWKKQIRAAWKHADPDEQLPRPEHGTDLLRARAYLALLLGQPLDVPPADLLPPAEAPGPAPDASAGPDGAAARDAGVPDGPSGPASPAGPGSQGPVAADSPGGLDDQPVPAGLRRPGPGPGSYRGDPVAALPTLAGSINLTLPLATLLGLADRPGDVAGYGPMHGDIVRALATAAVGHPATNWGLIITDPNGQAVGYGYAPRAQPIRGHPADGWTITLTTQRIARGCHSP